MKISKSLIRNKASEIILAALFLEAKKFSIKFFYYVVNGSKTYDISLQVGKTQYSLADFVSRKIKQAKKIVRKVKTQFSFMPVYFQVDSMDCDCSRSVRAVRYKNMREAERCIDSIYDNAEGPIYVTRISKKDYQSFKSYRRDLAAEAYENGHSHIVYR